MKTKNQILASKNYLLDFEGARCYYSDHVEEAMEEYASQFRSEWISVSDRLPDKYGRYFVCRKDGKIHWEIWNGCGWAYNNKAITYWMTIPEVPKGGKE